MKCVPALDLGYLGPVSLHCFNAKYSQNRCMTWISVDFDTRVRLHLMWNVIWRLTLVFQYMIWSIWVGFPQMCLIPKFPKTGITWPSDSFTFDPNLIRCEVWIWRCCISFSVFLFLCCKKNYFCFISEYIYIYIYIYIYGHSQKCCI